MGALRAVIRMGVLWLLSLAVAMAGMEADRRLVAATDHGGVTAADVGLDHRAPGRWSSSIPP
jgi:hypothetical protein